MKLLEQQRGPKSPKPQCSRVSGDLSLKGISMPKQSPATSWKVYFSNVTMTDSPVQCQALAAHTGASFQNAKG